MYSFSFVFSFLLSLFIHLMCFFCSISHICLFRKDDLNDGCFVFIGGVDISGTRTKHVGLHCAKTGDGDGVL
ncbi:hypothetical protein V8F06_006423 [Rhypophila decipiens]